MNEELLRVTTWGDILACSHLPQAISCYNNPGGIQQPFHG